MSVSWERIEDAPLYGEHVLLGAQFGEDQLLGAPRCYGMPEEEPRAFVEGCALVDLSGMTSALISGEGSDAFVEACCAQRTLAVGECAFGATLTGDGSLAAMPLVARTGDAEYLICDPSSRGLMLHPWLGFVAAIEQDGYRPYGGVAVEDVSDALVPLLFWGPQATAILGDYVRDVTDLPDPGRVANVRLDRIETLVAHVPCLEASCYLLMVPPAAARVLWRSLLSFGATQPVGSEQLCVRAAGELPWMSLVLGGDRMEPRIEELLEWDVARPEGGFIGERALLS